MDDIAKKYIVGMVACVAVVAVVGMALTIPYGKGYYSAASGNIRGAAVKMPDVPEDRPVPGTAPAAPASQRQCTAGHSCTDPLTSTFTDRYCETVVTKCQNGCDKATGLCKSP